MNRPEPRRIAPLLYALSWMACGGGVDDPNAKCSQDLADKVQFDCEQTIQCKVNQGMLAPRSDLVQQCFDSDSAALAASPAARTQFLSNFGRCGRLSLCDYSGCASTGAHGFGEMQLASIAYNCQQTIDCNSTQAALVCNTSLAIDDCTALTVGELDNGSPAEQQAYIAASARCAGRVGCDFVNCIKQ